MRASFFFSHLAREARGQRWRVVFFVACLAIGVAAVVAVASLATGFDRSLRGEARQLLGADLAIESWRPIPPEVEATLTAIPGSALARIEETVTLVAGPARADGRPGPSRLVELKAVESGYPFYGEVALAPPGRLADALDPAGAVAQPDLLRALGIGIGDELAVGGSRFVVRAEVTAEPDRIGGAFSLGPRLFLSREGLAKTGLVARGSRVENKLLWKAPETWKADELAALAKRLKDDAGASYRVETYTEAQPQLRRGIRRAESFLGLVALLSLLAGGIGVAQTVRAWLEGRLDAIAVLKCLGVRPREVLWLYLGQTVALGLFGSLVGALLGVLVQLALPALLGPLVPAGVVQPWQPGAILRGLGLGTAVAAIFCLGPLSSLLQVPPARVLRRNAEPLAQNRIARWAIPLVLGAGIFGLATFQADSVPAGLGFTAGIGVAGGLLTLAAWGLIRLARHLRDRLAGGPIQLTQGLAALTRPGAGTLGAIVALGLGVLVVLATFLVEDRLAGRLEAELPQDAPNLFLIDIQPQQWPGVSELLTRYGALRQESVPVITARLAAIDGASTEALAKTRRGGQRWALTREQRLTYLDQLPADNEVVEGELFADPDQLEISVEKEFAQELGIAVGSLLAFDIQGVTLDLVVTSLRTVNWEGFGLNFYLVAEPAALAEAPQQRVAAVRLPEEAEQDFQDDLAARYPNVTLINLREILTKVAAVLRRISLGVRLLGSFTTLAGIAILGGAVSASAARRGREVALLKTLGMTRWGVAGSFAVEYALTGLVAGGIGAVGAGALAWVVLTRRMEVPWETSPWPFLAALGITIALATVAGLLASARALAERPIEVLRGEG
ncbi:MAG TPA: FtsX-like permease family protein [Thermoanaerobaculia bacterium]|nr:FtsX-like permease family protein [Thermoanaerobaculia bacterium]